MSVFKANAIARNLKERLEASLSDASISTELSDSFPVIRVVRGTETILIKVDAFSPIVDSVNLVGNSQEVYAPHKIIILRDNSPSDAPLREVVSAEVAKSGSTFEIYEIASMPASFSLTGATLLVKVLGNPWYPVHLS